MADVRNRRVPPIEWQYPELYHHADPYTVKRQEELPGDLDALKLGAVLGVITGAVLCAAPLVEMWFQS